jgi:hypothetical protein
VNAGVQGLDDEVKTGVAPAKTPEESIGRTAVAPEHPVFDVIRTERIVAHPIIHPLEKIPDLLHRIPDPQGNYPVDDDDVIEVDPEGDLLFPAGQRGRVQGL